MGEIELKEYDAGERVISWENIEHVMRQKAREIMPMGSVYSGVLEEAKVEAILKESEGRYEEEAAARGWRLVEAMVISQEEFEEYVRLGGSERETFMRSKEQAALKELMSIMSMGFHGSFPEYTTKELIPIHCYFQFLIARGKALQEDEVNYIKSRYGWLRRGESADFSFETWDGRLAKLNILWRGRVMELISPEDFERLLQAL